MADENEIYQKKNSFILYKNYINSVSKMSNEQAGELFKIILHYANTGELLESEDPRVDTALDFIGERLEFDMQKYLDTCEKRKAAGAKGGSSSKKEQDEEAADQKQTNANAKTNKQTKANEKEKSKTKQTQAKFPILKNGSGGPGKLAERQCNYRRQSLPVIRTHSGRIVFAGQLLYLVCRPDDGFKRSAGICI